MPCVVNSECVFSPPLRFFHTQTPARTCGSDYNALSRPVDMSDCNEIPDQAWLVYLGLVLNVSPASSTAVTLLRRMDSPGRDEEISHTSITHHPQQERMCTRTLSRSLFSLSYREMLSSCPAVRTELISKAISVSNISRCM